MSGLGSSIGEEILYVNGLMLFSALLATVCQHSSHFETYPPFPSSVSDSIPDGFYATTMQALACLAMVLKEASTFSVENETE